MNSILEALQFLSKHAKNSSYIKDYDGFIDHALDISFIIMNTLNQTPEIGINKLEMRIAGLWHDIGRCISYDGLHHPIIGAEFLEQQEYECIAKIIRTHNFIKEIVEKTKYKDINPKSLEVTTWNEALITHASMICGNGRVITFDEKLKQQRDKRDVFFRKVSEKGEARVRDIYDSVEKLKSGDNDIVKKYKVL